MRLSRGKAEGEPETRELCRAPNPRTRYSLSNLYHPGMRGFERIATRGNKKCGLCPYLIHTFGSIACIKSDVGWLASERSERDTIRGVQIRAGAVYIYIYIYMYGGTYAILVAHATHT